VSVVPNDGDDPDVLMRNAGLALRHAKEAGPHRYEFFSAQFNEQALSRLDLGAELRHALSRDEIELLYQPRVDLASGRMVAAQASLCWHHASGRVVEGDALLDLAGPCEMDVALFEWLFEQLHRHMRNWKAAGLQPVPIGVPAPLANLHVRDLVQMVNAAVAAGVEPRHLSLELQNVGMADALAPGDAAAIAGLRKKGVRLSLDRFGAAASVAHLRKLACDEIKLDTSFVRDLEQDATAQAMLLGMGDLARRLKLTCVATGIATPQQLAFLRKNGCDQGQGPIVGEPLAGLPFAAKWLTRSGRPPRVPLPAEG
jgi:EAL domain-containing protein (putative c-di-GMP-specific phosphodiesterase class I)